MSSPTARIAAAVLALLLGTVAAAPAGAQGREFAGSVVSVSGETLVVEDRRGDRVRFTRSEKTVVEGRPDWGAIGRGDRVIVQWRLADGPRHARRVIVLGGAR